MEHGTACIVVHNWYVYVMVGLISFFGGLAILIPARFIWYCFVVREDGELRAERHKRNKLWGWSARIRAGAVALMSGHTKGSKALLTFVFLCNMLSIIIYFVTASRCTFDECPPVRTDPFQQIYIALCVIFIVSYVIRFIAATDKLFFWLDIYSIVDHLTIGASFYALYTDKNWIALRFFRILYLMQLSEIGQMVHLLKSTSKIRLTQIASIFISVWFTSSGFAMLIENTEDFDEDPEAYKLTYWSSVYWLLVTMSTVGFGEISPKTDICRAFIVIYIIGTFAMFTAIVPELITHIGVGGKYKKPYKRIYGKRHIIVCGHICFETVSGFIREFIHEEAENRDINLVFIDSKKPNLEMEAFFRRHCSDVTFIQGSVMDTNTLRDAKIRDACAVLILANRSCEDPDEEDAANIMRAAALKNIDPSTRIIIQLLQYHNKTHLLHLPNWTWDRENGDDVICIAELKLGLMAQNCLAPGVCTLMANLFTMRSYKPELTHTWQDEYRLGAGNEIYIQKFSPAFVGLSFQQAAELCFTELHILLVGIQSDSTLSRGRVRLNPQGGATISIGTTGFFIAQSPEEVRRVTTYKPKKGGMGDEHSLKHNIPLKPISVGRDYNQYDGNVDDKQVDHLETVGSRLASYRQRKPSMDLTAASDGRTSEIFDYTGMFHWCETRSLEDSTIDCGSALTMGLNDHVVLCLVSDESSPVIGLTNFVMPLRTSNFRRDELKRIVILGNPDYLQKEWDALSNFPEIYIFNGTSSHRPDLRAVEVEKCSMCVILSAKRHIVVDTTLLDKECILTSLNVQGMFGRDTENKMRSLGIISGATVDSMPPREIPITAELEIESNVVFLDQDDDDDPDCPLYMTHPYVTGSALSSGSLDALMQAVEYAHYFLEYLTEPAVVGAGPATADFPRITKKNRRWTGTIEFTFQNSNILTLVRALITGGDSAELERILAEGLGIVRKYTPFDHQMARERCRLSVEPLASGLFGGLLNMQHGATYGALFVQALQRYGVLCLGLYRLMEREAKPTSERAKRFVITNPHASFQLIHSDKVYCLRPTEINKTLETLTERSPKPSTSDNESSPVATEPNNNLDVDIKGATTDVTKM